MPIQPAIMFHSATFFPTFADFEPSSDLPSFGIYTGFHLRRVQTQGLLLLR